MNRGQASDHLIRAALPMGQKLVLMVYMMHQSSKDKPESAVSWPALATIVRYVQASRSFVMEARNALIEAGLLVVVERPDYGNIRCRIAFDRLVEAPEEESTECKRRNRGKRDRTASPPGTAIAPHRDRNSSPPGTATAPLQGPPRLPKGTATAPRSLRRDPSVENPSEGTPPQPSATRGTGATQPSPDLTATPPPAEPSGSPSDLWLAAADLAEGGDPPRAESEPPAEDDPESWRASLPEQFQPSSDAYTFEEADQRDIPEQPSDPRPIESPAVERTAPNPQFGPGIHPQTSTITASQRNAQPTDAKPARALEAPPQGLRPSPTHPPGNGEGAPGPVAPPQSAPSLFGRIDTAPEAQKPAKAPPRASKPQPPPVDLTSPDDPCPLLLGAKVSIGDLTEGIVAVYRSWWRRQPSPATCKITVGRVKLIRQALEGGCSVEQLVHLVRYAYEAADIGTYQRAWRGEDGKTPPDLEMLLRGDKFERNVEISGRWNVERIGEGSGPLPENVHPFPMPPPRPTRRDFQGDRFAILQEMIMENQRNAQL